MQKKTCIKTRFTQFNDKHFYFSDGITSLPFSLYFYFSDGITSHPYLEELAEFKGKMGQKIGKYFCGKKSVSDREQSATKGK